MGRSCPSEAVQSTDCSATQHHSMRLQLVTLKTRKSEPHCRGTLLQSQLQVQQKPLSPKDLKQTLGPLRALLLVLEQYDLLAGHICSLPATLRIEVGDIGHSTGQYGMSFTESHLIVLHNKGTDIVHQKGTFLLRSSQYNRPLSSSLAIRSPFEHGLSTVLPAYAQVYGA